MKDDINMVEDEELKRRAEKIAREKVGFQVHLSVYIAVNVFLIAIWFFTTDPWGSVFPWFIFPLFGWGIGIVAHFVGAYRGEGYVKTLAEKEYARLKQK